MVSKPKIALFVLALSVLGCGSSLRKYPLTPPLWRDPDQHVFSERPEEYYSPFAWDAANQTVFRPISRFFAVDPAGESVNVNAFDEVPNSSWFVNRIGRYGMTPEEMSQAPCAGASPLDPNGPWTVTGAKPNGFNPGFLLKDAAGKRYLAKFDGVTEGSRPTAADVVGSLIYHAAGYYVPCNRIAYFDRKILVIDPKATSETPAGDKVPLEQKHLDAVFDKAIRAKDGRYRANISLFVEGKPIGPWTYEGRRGDDPNDVINHEDRRDLRGMEVLAAWANHFDSREQNTLATFVEAPGGGYVRHNVIDFGDCFGSIWEPPMMGRRIGHAYYLDIPYVLEDFITLGIPKRPWDEARFGPTGSTLGYYDVEHFDPDMYRPGYPNPAFGRKREHDSAWMARIIARMSDAHLRAIVKEGEVSPLVERVLFEVLRGRRDRDPSALPESAVSACLAERERFEALSRRHGGSVRCGQSESELRDPHLYRR